MTIVGIVHIFSLTSCGVGMRSKILLLFFVFVFVSLLSSVAFYWHGKKTTAETLQSKAEHEAKFIQGAITRAIIQKQTDLVIVSRSEAIKELLRQPTNNSIAKESLGILTKGDLPSFAIVSVINRDGENVIDFVSDSYPKNSSHPTLVDENIWATKEEKPLQPRIIKDSFGVKVRFVVPIFADGVKKEPQGVLVADLGFDRLVNDFDLLRPNNAFMFVSGKDNYVVHHTNPSLRYQPVDAAMSASFSKINEAMQRGENSWQFYDAKDGLWLVAYRKIEGTDLAIAVGESYTNAIQGSQRIVLIGLALTLLSGAILTFLLWRILNKHARNLERVAEGTAAIAEGNLDKSLAALSSEDLQPLGANVNVIIEFMRAQMKREHEAQQFQTFARLTAMLTHDIKNSATALALLVKNMETRYHDEEFREDAMKSLRLTADKLQKVIEEINQPVTTLGSDFKSLAPGDIIPIIKRVVAATAEQNFLHEIELKLPEKLEVRIDPAKIEKVIENLIINSIEAMKERKGKLTIEAGKIDEKESFFSVADTGIGISKKFQKENLFRPFATTKEKGIGLGLYSCKEIVTTHNGRIEVVSEKNIGTTFKVVLPSA
jgi:signal transduction histidine kinase